MAIVVSILVGALGAVMGSFAGAMVWRLRQKKNCVSDRSECESCRHKLSGLDLIPIFSFLALRGRCRYCQQPIAREILCIEVVGALAFMLSYLFFPDFGFDVVKNTTLLAVWLAILAGFLVLGLYDSKHAELPDVALYPTLTLSLIFCGLRMVWAGTPFLIGVREFLLALLPVAGFYLLLWLVGQASKKELIGFGDVKLGVVLVGFLTFSQAVLVLFGANLLGALLALPMLLSKKWQMKSRIPFGPCLIIVAVVVFLTQFSLAKLLAFMYTV